MHTELERLVLLTWNLWREENIKKDDPNWTIHVNTSWISVNGVVLLSHPDYKENL